MGLSNRRWVWHKDLVCGSTASTAVEYSLLLALIAGAILGLGILIGGPLQKVFSGSASGLQSLSVAETGQGIAGDSGNAASQSVAPAHPARADWAIWFALAAGCAVPLSVAPWLLRRRARREAPHDELAAALVPPELQARFVEKRHQIFSYLSAEARHIAKGGMTVRNIMSTPPVRRSPQDKVEGLRDQMKEKEIHHLVVCTPEDKVVGIVSDRDVLGRKGTLVSEIMTSNPATVTPETPLGTIISMFLAKRISCVPVVEHKRLCGIITSTDILMLLQCVLRLLEQLALPAELHSHAAETLEDQAEPEPVESL